MWRMRTSGCPVGTVLMSAPAQNVCPAPVITTQRTDSSMLALRSSPKRISQASVSSAFRRAGRFSVRVSTWPCRAAVIPGPGSVIVASPSSSGDDRVDGEDPVALAEHHQGVNVDALDILAVLVRVHRQHA